MLSLGRLCFEKASIALVFQQDEAGFGTTTLWSWEFLLISEHNLPRFKFLNVKVWPLKHGP